MQLLQGRAQAVVQFDKESGDSSCQSVLHKDISAESLREALVILQHFEEFLCTSFVLDQSAHHPRCSQGICAAFIAIGSLIFAIL